MLMRTVMVFGTFDIVHLGHLHLFKEARMYGDHLIVVIATAANAERVKGRTPVYTDEERRDFLSHIDLVDEVVIGSQSDVYAVISVYQPDVIVLGYDQETFVDRLADELQLRSPHTDIKRASPFDTSRFKSQKFKEYIERHT